MRPPEPAAESLLEWLACMLLIRRFEERAGELYARAKVGGFLHLAIGEEAAIVGAARALKTQDYLVSTYRSHGYALARGAAPGSIMAELLGRSDGCSKGRGGSMHMFDLEHRFMGGYGIVGGNLPIAAGLALAADYSGGDEATLCTLGDGACNQGTFGESLNLAALWRLPIVFMVTNNQYGMGTALERHSAVTELRARGEGLGVPGSRCDGMDVLDTYGAVSEALQTARQERRPQLIEAITYRFRGHSMADPERYRTREQVERWRERDAIESFRGELTARGAIDEAGFARIQAEAGAQVDAAVAFAEESPHSEPSALYDDVYVLGEQVRGWYSLRTTDPERHAATLPPSIAGSGEIAQQLSAALAQGDEARAAHAEQPSDLELQETQAPLTRPQSPAGPPEQR